MVNTTLKDCTRFDAQLLTDLQFLENKTEMPVDTMPLYCSEIRIRHGKAKENDSFAIVRNSKINNWTHSLGL
jgi:hypothetical protein